jgi:hypothetical protein
VFSRDLFMPGWVSHFKSGTSGTYILCIYTYQSNHQHVGNVLLLTPIFSVDVRYPPQAAQQVHPLTPQVATPVLPASQRSWGPPVPPSHKKKGCDLKKIGHGHRECDIFLRWPMVWHLLQNGLYVLVAF